MLDLKFSSDDAQTAYDEWRCNCGPAALACCLGIALSEVKLHIGEFSAKGYMSPTMMKVAVEACGGEIRENSKRRNWPSSLCPDILPGHGLVRVQWCGPWTKPGSNPRWAYGATHWIATCDDPAFPLSDQHKLIFDVNSGLTTFDTWRRETVPRIIESIPRADGGWYCTHLWEIKKR